MHAEIQGQRDGARFRQLANSAETRTEQVRLTRAFFDSLTVGSEKAA